MAKKSRRLILTGLFGHPVAHSLSPFFVNLVFHRLGIPSVYLAFDIAPASVAGAFAALRILDFRGVNVTVPHKTAAFRHVDRLAEDASGIGAVNCIVHREGTLVGHNTDHLGFTAPLDKNGIDLSGKRALLVGCGGAARSVLYALHKKGVKEVVLVNRTERNAADFLEWSRNTIGFQDIRYAGDEKSLDQKILGGADLVINTTPVGMYPDAAGIPVPPALRFSPNQIVYDLIYNPRTTGLLKKARAEGAFGIDGLAMLTYQGLHSIALWFPEKSGRVFRLRGTVMRRMDKRLRDRG
jgi:shikimate dehydrogenase